MAIYLYLDNRSFVHRLHPTVKVAALFVMFWSVYWVDNPIALVPIGLLMLWLARITGSWRNFYRYRWYFAILVATTTLMWMFFYRQGAPLIDTRFIHISRASLTYGFGRGIKLAELLGASVLFLSTTRVEEFTVGLSKLGVSYRVGFAISLAFRLVPLFMDSAFTIADAQKLRGYDFESGGFAERMRKYVKVVIPVFMGALRRANNMAMALEARGFGLRNNPTTLIEYPVTARDIAAAAALFALAAGYFMIYYTGYGAISPR
jgi:energy-coupling factor transport system permease protein